jgi:hypothetical protein
VGAASLAGHGVAPLDANVSDYSDVLLDDECADEATQSLVDMLRKMALATPIAAVALVMIKDPSLDMTSSRPEGAANIPTTSVARTPSPIRSRAMPRFRMTPSGRSDMRSNPANTLDHPRCKIATSHAPTKLQFQRPIVNLRTMLPNYRR